MTPEQALAVLRQEAASGSATGKALLLYLESAEIAAFRQTARSSDALTTATMVGRAQGIGSILTAITPAAAPAPQGPGARL